ncbi:doubled CXXCH motif protein [Geobacter sp. OR-1]|uniref:cytochrome c3 family protein n=1 Tax=Geobacter sp. OR-1 TaxID=1266765 RepID=UPI000543FE18|nr:cytochrome c3 family protein [Geobacter sp. OR-1]GAM09483.1 doubled CXXCH motif protein [Geobacter sp. OR-1]
MKRLIALLAAVSLIAAATYAISGSIVGTPHDFSGGYGGTDLGSDQICVYCHTPHNPVKAVPLWNRINQSHYVFEFYKTSATLTTATKASGFNSGSVSLFCMNCHDGQTALGSIKNPGVDSNNNTIVMDTSTVIRSTYGDILTTDLTNSHPVGFNYASAASQDATLAAKATVESKLKTANVGGVIFFNDDANNTGDMMECASCHKVHDNEYTKFLRISNVGSNLCFACHIK